MTETAFVRPAPAQTVETKPFWEAANRGTLLFGHCNACGERHFYPRRMCPHCFSSSVEWVPASGDGTIHSFSVVNHKQFPYVLAYVTLTEGVTVFTNVVDADPARLAIGAAVRLAFEASSDGQQVPVFRVVR